MKITYKEIVDHIKEQDKRIHEMTQQIELLTRTIEKLTFSHLLDKMDKLK